MRMSSFSLDQFTDKWELKFQLRERGPRRQWSELRLRDYPFNTLNYVGINQWPFANPSLEHYGLRPHNNMLLVSYLWTITTKLIESYVILYKYDFCIQVLTSSCINILLIEKLWYYISRIKWVIDWYLANDLPLFDHKIRLQLVKMIVMVCFF